LFYGLFQRIFRPVGKDPPREHVVTQNEGAPPAGTNALAGRRRRNILSASFLMFSSLASDLAAELRHASAVGWYSAVVGLLELNGKRSAWLVAGARQSRCSGFITAQSLLLRPAWDCFLFRENRNRSAVDA
jgi:hypothetical protein